MIYIDKSEGRTTSKLPHLPIAQYVVGLEEKTGADILISAKDTKFPQDRVLDGILNMHLKTGMLVQLKVGQDAIQSVADKRLDDAIERMQKAVDHSWQRWLVVTGIFTKGAKDSILLYGKQTSSQLNYWSFIGALTAWGESGGSFINLDSENSVAKWLITREQRLKDLLANPVREFFPIPEKFSAESNILRKPQKVVDGRTILAAIPGIGISKATALFENFNTAAHALEFLSDPDALTREDKVPGIGEAKLREARIALGLGTSEKIIVGKSLFPLKIRWPAWFADIICSPHNQWVKIGEEVEVTYISPLELETTMLAMTSLKEYFDEKKAKEKQ